MPHLTAGELKAVLAKVPDNAKVFMAQDDLAQWFDTVGQAFAAYVEEDEDACVLNPEDDGLEANAVMLFRQGGESALSEPEE